MDNQKKQFLADNFELLRRSAATGFAQIGRGMVLTDIHGGLDVLYVPAEGIPADKIEEARMVAAYDPESQFVVSLTGDGIESVYQLGIPVGE